MLGVDANGSLNRYQRGAHDGAQEEWVIYYQFGWYRRSKAFVPYGMKAFFITHFAVRKTGHGCSEPAQAA